VYYTQFSKADAEAYPEYEAMLDKLVHFINPLIDEIPPNLGESPFSGSPKQVRPTRRHSNDVTASIV
jgi:hypothetical protein